MTPRHFGLSRRPRFLAVSESAHCRCDGSSVPLRGPMMRYGPATPNQVTKATHASETSHRPFWTAQIAACVRFLTLILRRITFT